MICSYPLSSVGILLAANELNFTPKMLGGAMVGLQSTVFKDKLKSKLNGVVNYETWVPSPKLMAPAADVLQDLSGARQGRGHRSARLLSRRLGLCLFPVARRSDRRRQELNDDKLADYMHSHEFKTIMGDVKFGQFGEWTKQASLQVQYHGITDAANLETWRGMSYQTVLTPEDQKTGDLIYPYAKA